MKFNYIWKERIQSNHGENIQKGNELSTYALFKHNFNMEKYLQFGSRNQRRNICKFRISNHKHEIEQGRYKNVSADKRTCKLCNTGVEDEIHFLFVTNLSVVIFLEYLECIGNSVTIFISYLPVHILSCSGTVNCKILILFTNYYWCAHFFVQ